MKAPLGAHGTCLQLPAVGLTRSPTVRIHVGAVAPVAVGGRASAEGSARALASPAREVAVGMADLVPGMDETRNSGEWTASFSSARKRKSYSAETSASAGRPPDLCDSYNRMRLTRAGGRTAGRSATARVRAALGLWLPNLVPTHDRGP